ncbi:hypothetical protein Taro_015322 [Colocasia esculenta]|uniref:Uncharacterized protein n=1 Tax=Colocasia esculenta TaxID=4460 RepID=A0A843UB69_COLES|nr:hypothetical protein [Colocasia esculenta]
MLIDFRRRLPLRTWDGFRIRGSGRPHRGAALPHAGWAGVVRSCGPPRNRGHRAWSIRGALRSGSWRATVLPHPRGGEAGTAPQECGGGGAAGQPPPPRLPYPASPLHRVPRPAAV